MEGVTYAYLDLTITIESGWQSGSAILLANRPFHFMDEKMQLP